MRCPGNHLSANRTRDGSLILATASPDRSYMAPEGAQLAEESDSQAQRLGRDAWRANSQRGAHSRVEYPRPGDGGLHFQTVRVASSGGATANAPVRRLEARCGCCLACCRLVGSGVAATRSP